MYKRLELHNHTTESDGSLSCKELIEFMAEDGVDAFAITDHNTISGHKKIKELLKTGVYNTKCIYGMEYTTYYGHILCFNLTEYVPWDSINFFKPELLFEAAKDKGAIVGIAHPFSFGAPFARGCRFEMKITDFSSVDFIEVFNNPEPLHEVNERGLLWWEELVLSGHSLAATCGMDLHGKSEMGNQYATFIEGCDEGDISNELAAAIHDGKTWVSRGILLLCRLDDNGESLFLKLYDTAKKGYIPSSDDRYIVTLTSSSTTISRQIGLGEEICVSIDNADKIIIPKLYSDTTTIENLICLSPVIYR